jgi:CheY-like chemotaxis protein/CHASE3 domain sensor protein
VFSKKFLIGQRIGLGFAISIFALIAVGFFSLRSLDEMQRESTWVTHTIEVMAEVRLLNDSLSRMESSGRGYLLTGEAALKEELRQQRKAADISLQKLRRLTLDNPAQTTRIDEYDTLFSERTEMAEGLVAVRDSNPAGVDPRVARLVLNGQKISSELRRVAAAMNAEEARLLAQRQEISAQASRATRNTVIYGSLATLFIVLGTGVLLARGITGPLGQLGRSATRIGAGDYAHRADIHTGDEVQQLSESFNEMAAQIEQRQLALANQDWLKGGLARFAALSLQQRDPAAVGQALLGELATLIGARWSALYLVAGNGHPHLKLIASYAASGLPDIIAPGENLAGQSFVDRRRITVTGPAGYVRIGSALGDTEPVAVVVEPVLFEDEVRAVLELASLTPFTELQLELIGRLAADLGSVLQNILTAQRTEELLRQSQALTVQLEEQHHSLEEKNAELEEQTERLRKSEILLQEQQVELQQTNEELEQSNEEMQQANEEMEEKTNLLAIQKRELENTNRVVEQARGELQEKARQLTVTSTYKSNFLATMSHELRTPLNSLLILARLLGENRDANLTPKQIQFARTIESSGADLLEMINQILDLAKIESGHAELQVSEVSFDELQRSLEHQFRHVAETKSLGYTVTLTPGLPVELRTDAGRLNQILKNLLANAFKFTERGSVAVEIRPATAGWRASPSLSQAKSVVAIAVTDTGIGIPKDKQDIVFESFQQADAGVARRFGGTGLGLSISREIALLLGGVLQVESEPGQGSTFTLFIPAEVTAAAPRVVEAAVSPGRALPPSPEAAHLTEDLTPETGEGAVADDREIITPSDRVILIIEDDHRFAAILADFAREKRFKVLVAHSARRGVSLAQRYQPVAITLDLRLVDQDGWLVLDQLKHNERTRHIPVHVISVEPGRNRGLRLGAVSYLQKPVTKEAINNILQQTVDFIERPVKNLLVVEDDSVQRESIRELIGNNDVHTTTAGSAAEALAALEKERFDCIVLDLMLPDQSGVDLIREINRRLGLQSPPVIIYTGKELTPREETELRSLSESIIVKDARSPERLLDETALFLHRVQARLPEAKRRMLERVRRQDVVLTGRHVLVVDDDVRNIFALTAVLEGYGMVVRFAESGQAALDQLAGDAPCDAVLMDVMMPGMDGNEAIRRLRRDSRFVKLPIIAVTAKAMKGDRERSIEAGASDYITKPVDTEKLLSLLRVWLYR